MRTILTLTSLAAISAAVAQPAQPVFQWHYSDAITGDNSFNSGGKRNWDVDAGADRYQNDVYERPTIQTYGNKGGRYGTEEYFGYLDIVRAQAGHDNRYLYGAIELFDRNNSTADGKNTEKGLVEQYGIRFGNHADGKNSYLIYADQPELASSQNTVFSGKKTFGFHDSDGDVGGSGRNVTKSDNPGEEAGMNGYDRAIFSDGMDGANNPVLWARLRPGNSKVVEFALDFVAMGLTTADVARLQYLEFHAIKGGPKDPQNYMWNDKYTKSEAGSPNAGPGGLLSEFGTQGLGNIYELDTLSAGAVPEPGTVAVLGLGVAAFLRRRRK